MESQKNITYEYAGPTKDNNGSILVIERQNNARVFLWTGYMKGNLVTLYPRGYYGNRKLDNKVRKPFQISIHAIERRM